MKVNPAVEQIIQAYRKAGFTRVPDARTVMRRVQKGPGRNEPCVCGSGRKYKRCCMALEGIVQERSG